jgi:ribosomal protein S18 acetylase RimI-like enzyme
MAAHVLDRPIWHALGTRQAELAIGGPSARRFPADVAAFGAGVDDRPESLAALGALAGEGLIILQAGEAPAPPALTVNRVAAGVQMVAARRLAPPDDAGVVELGDADAAEMLALAQLTEPGPFFARTHTLGGFVGVRREGRLVAMAGERLKLDGFTEVSGVCVHPDQRGAGLAARLSAIVAARIFARGETPFLHAYAENAAAIALYRKLGFELRTEVTMKVLGPPS